MQVGKCANCGADYGPDDLVCSYCGSPVEREPAGYGGLNQQSYQSSNGGTQVIQNIYVTNNGSGNTSVGGSLGDTINNAVNRVTQTASSYNGSTGYRRNRILAALLAIFLGSFGVQFFYLNKPGIGVLCVIFCYTGIPAIIGFIHCVLLLKMSDDEFEYKYHR